MDGRGEEEELVMTRKLLRAKIHRATVTGADLHYEGSVTIDRELMSHADLVEHEAVHVWNVTNGERFETYVIPGVPGSGVVCVNGAAAHKVSQGDLVIIAAFSWMDEKEARSWKPRIVFVDDRNRRLSDREELGGQTRVLRAFA
jgi:aspartate 1-decarboxylase